MAASCPVPVESTTSPLPDSLPVSPRPLLFSPKAPLSDSSSCSIRRRATTARVPQLGMAAATTMTSRRIFALAAVFVLAVCCLPAAAAAPQGKQYRVGGEDGWRVPPPEDKDKYYDNWASNITFYVDDSLEFVYKNDSVLRVSKAGYYHCNETAGDAAPHDGRTVFLLDAPGYAYFAGADLQHCGMGERLAVSVLPTAGPPPAPSPTSWSSAPGPWSWVLSPSSAAPAASSPSGEHSAAAPVVASSSAHHAIVLVAVALAAGLL